MRKLQQDNSLFCWCLCDCFGEFILTVERGRHFRNIAVSHVCFVGQIRGIYGGRIGGGGERNGLCKDLPPPPGLCLWEGWLGKCWMGMGRQREVGKLPYKANVLPQVRPSSRTQRAELKGSHLHLPRGGRVVFLVWFLVCHSLCLKIPPFCLKEPSGKRNSTE